MSFEFFKSPIHLVGYPVAVLVGFWIAYGLEKGGVFDGTTLIVSISAPGGATVSVILVLFGLNKALHRKTNKENSSQSND